MQIIEISENEYQIINYIYNNYNTPIISEKLLLPLNKFIISSNDKYYLSNNDIKMNNILINKLNEYYTNIIDNASEDELNNIKTLIFKIYEINGIIFDTPEINIEEL